MASLLQQKNASIKRLKRLIFGPSSDKRAFTESSTEEEASPGNDSEQLPCSGSSPGTVRSSSADQKPKRPGRGRMAASAYIGAEGVICRHQDFKAGDHCPDPLCRSHLYAVSSPTISGLNPT